MKLIGIMPVRNEAYVLGLTARAALMWLDSLVILDHASTDGTMDIIDDLSREYPGRVSSLYEPDPLWREMSHRQRLLERARLEAATHVITIDADELLSGNLLGTGGAFRHIVQSTPEGSVLQIPWLALKGSPDRVVTTGPWADGQNVSIAFRDDQRWHWSAQNRGGYDHHHRHPAGMPLKPYTPLAGRNAGLMHLQFVSERRLRAKQYWYQLTERSRWPQREAIATVRERYSLAVNGPGNCAAVPREWWEPYRHLMQYFHPDAEPWQFAECERMLSENPALGSGLDDFGLFAKQE